MDSSGAKGRLAWKPFAGIDALVSLDPSAAPVASGEAARQQSPPEENLPAPPSKSSLADSPADMEDFLLKESFAPRFQEQSRAELRRCLAEAEELQRSNRWDDILALFHPLEGKVPSVVDAGIDLGLRLKVAFALGQTGRFEEALKCLQPALKLHPDDFWVHSAIGYNAYQSLLKRDDRKVALIPEQKRDRIRLAHHHFKCCQDLRPDHVTSFYREGMLYKEVEGKTVKACDCFQKAIENWTALTEEQRTKRHQERPKYMRSLYHMASCLLSNKEPRRALDLMQRCFQEDQTDVLSPVHKHFGMAKILYGLCRYQDALDHLETAGLAAQAGEPTDYIWELAARSALLLGKPEKGMDYLGRIPEKRRRHYVRWTESDLLVALGRDAEAEQVLLRSAERDRRSRHRALMRLAQLHYRQSDSSRALQAAEQANRFCLDTFGNECQDALFWRAACLHRLGRFEEADQTLNDLQRLNPNYPNLCRLQERIRGGLMNGRT